MTSYKLIFQKPAKKFILKHKKIGLKFYQAFIEVSENRSNFNKYDIKKLRNQEDGFRMRIGKYRAIFRVVEKEIVIIVFDIDSRGGIYK